MNLLIDTGSSNIVISSIDCTQDVCNLHKKYDYKKSKSVKFG